MVIWPLGHLFPIFVQASEQISFLAEFPSRVNAMLQKAISFDTQGDDQSRLSYNIRALNFNC